MHRKSSVKRMEAKMSSKDRLCLLFHSQFCPTKISETNNGSLDLITFSLILNEKVPKPWYSVHCAMITFASFHPVNLVMTDNSPTSFFFTRN